MPVLPLSGSRREQRGKGSARKARAAGEIPAVLYGQGEEPLAVAVKARDFDLMLREQKSGNPIVNLNVGTGEYTALVRDVQYDPLTHGILHIDFQLISLTETVDVEVPVHLEGIAVGVKDHGGILEQILRHVEVRSLPTDIPSALTLDVSSLNIGDSLHVRDLGLPGVTILSDPTSTVATVVPPTVVEEAAPAEPVEAVAGTEPELIAKGKKEEEEAAEKEKD
jgi:large subunit ribosomal protein L25